MRHNIGFKRVKTGLLCVVLLLLGAGCAPNPSIDPRQAEQEYREQMRRQQQAQAEREARERLEAFRREEEARQSVEAAARQALEKSKQPEEKPVSPQNCREGLTEAFLAAGVDAMVPDCFSGEDLTTCLLDIMPLTKVFKVLRFLAQMGMGVSDRMECRE